MFCIGLSGYSKENGIKSGSIHSYSPINSNPPWLFLSVSVDLYLLENSNLFKDTGNLPMLVEDRIQTLYQNYVAIYTDGSKDPTEEQHMHLPFHLYKYLTIGEHQISWQFIQLS